MPLEVHERFKHLVNGEWVGSAKTFEKRRPTDDALIDQIHEDGREEVDSTVATARGAMKGPWGEMTIEQTRATPFDSRKQSGIGPEGGVHSLEF